MGCGSSQTPKLINDANGKPDGVDDGLYAGTELVSSSGTAESQLTEENGSEKNTHPLKYPPPEAFEIPIEENDESLIKKHPPKRLQKLLEDRPQTPQTIEDLAEKLAKAEMRRQEILNQRIENTIKLREKDVEDNESDKETVIMDALDEHAHAEEIIKIGLNEVTITEDNKDLEM